MKLKSILLLTGCLLCVAFTKAQLLEEKNSFTKADTLRGSITEFRKGWDVIKYDLTVQPDIENKTITGKITITYNETSLVFTMQVDLQQPLEIDSVVGENNNSCRFRRDDNVCFVELRDSLRKYKFAPGVRKVTVYYHGKPKEAIRAPWDGGLVWKKDTKGMPFVATACQGLGASVWWPCKDHQSDEPDSGMTISIIAPENLSAVSNGRLVNVSAAVNGMETWNWEVKNPINSYDVTMNIGNYQHWSDTLMGEAGKLDLQYWVLESNAEKAKTHFVQVKPMLRSHEYWFGKYPFYEDGFKLVETPFLGMEHQSAVAYGNEYKNGYRGNDLSETGWGMKWDYIIVHESGHEWFGNNITTKDIADMWVHEGFTDYSETLFIETAISKTGSEVYCKGLRKNIENKRPIIGPYGVNKEGSGDMYYKGANMLQTIRHSINNDTLFRQILRGLNSTFYHQTVTTNQVENYISDQSGFNFSKVFDQYLRTIQIPVLEYYFSKNNLKIFFRWTNCINGFNLPLVVTTKDYKTLSMPATEKWLGLQIPAKVGATLPALIENKYYVQVKKKK